MERLGLALFHTGVMGLNGGGCLVASDCEFEAVGCGSCMIQKKLFTILKAGKRIGFASLVKLERYWEGPPILNVPSGEDIEEGFKGPPPLDSGRWWF